jgi:elongation factor Ts
MLDTKLITQLRDLTGAGIGDCREALFESENDINKAVEFLRKKGSVKAAKKSERQTKEGVIAIAGKIGKIAISGLACETDFVSRNQDFVDTVGKFSEYLLENGEENFKAWAESKIKDELIMKIGENIQLSEFRVFEGKVIGTYLHSNKKVAAAIVLSGGTVELATDLAMQIAAMSPKYIKPEDIPAEVIEKEKEIYQEQLKTEGKPQAMWEKIIPGKLNKYYEDVCLIKQTFIKDDKKKIEDLIAQSGQGIEVLVFHRFQI